MKIMRFIFQCISSLIFLALIAAGVIYMDYQHFIKTPVVSENSPTTYSIQKGDTLNALMNAFPEHHIDLQQASTLKKLPIPGADQLGNYYFRFLAKTHKKAKQLQVGDYAIKAGMTPVELLDALTDGQTVVHKIQFIEGWTFKKMREVLANNPNLVHTIDTMDDQAILTALGETTYTSPEGLFFPDTYTFPHNAKDIQVLKLSYDLMKKNLQTAWEARNPDIPIKTPYELLTLASIIEKETGVNSERERISGVFNRRLQQDMPLQTDPTIIYGMGDSYKGTIYKSDLKTDNPYNTYTRKGLPPTPIAMPSLASLMAAGQPDGDDALFFVANGKGGHTFSATYAEHKKAVEVYRQSLKQ